MLDDEILDSVIPIPDIEDVKNKEVQELKDSGFVITNFQSGGIFYTLLMIMIQCYIDLKKLVRAVLSNMFISSANDTWLPIKAADFAKKRKESVKTQGVVTLSRKDSGEAVSIPKGQVFKTIKDINGEELRYFVTADTVLQNGALSVDVPVEAETEGTRYNVPQGQISSSLTHIEGIDQIMNKEGWITTEGSDIEDIESLRSRVSYLIANDNGVTNFHFEISGDILDDSTIALIQQARDGLFQFEVGVQSINPQTIQAIHRRCDNNKLFEKVAQIKKKHNVHVHLDLIAGLPYEDYTSFGRSYDRVFAACPDMLQLGFLKVLKGSVMEQECSRYGIVYQEKSPYEVLFTNWLSYDDVLRLKKIEKLNETYCNSGRFVYSVKTVLKRFPSPFHFFEELSNYFTKNGYFEKGWAKYDAYLFLYDFYIQKFGESDELKWMMRHDIFSRENAKGIPAPLSETLFHIYRKKIEAFYDDRENIKHYLPYLEGEDGRKLSKITHLEIYPFCVLTEEPGATAILYDYGTKDVAGNAKIILLKNFN